MLMELPWTVFSSFVDEEMLVMLNNCAGKAWSEGQGRALGAHTESSWRPSHEWFEGLIYRCHNWHPGWVHVYHLSYGKLLVGFNDFQFYIRPVYYSGNLAWTLVVDVNLKVKHYPFLRALADYIPTFIQFIWLQFAYGCSDVDLKFFFNVSVLSGAGVEGKWPSVGANEQWHTGWYHLPKWSKNKCEGVYSNI